ncbi:putative reverse transcriptase domain-containing protein [Tanacetum coccineum]
MNFETRSSHVRIDRGGSFSSQIRAWEKHKLYQRTWDVRELHRESDLVEISNVSMRVFFVMSEELFVLNEGKQSVLKLKVVRDDLGHNDGILIAKVAIGGIRCGVCRQSGEEKGNNVGGEFWLVVETGELKKDVQFPRLGLLHPGDGVTSYTRRRHNSSSDGVTHFKTASARTDSNADLEDSFYDGGAYGCILGNKREAEISVLRSLYQSGMLHNELALMCPRMVEPESVKVDAYIRGLTDNIKGEVTLSRPANLNKVVRMAHKLMEQKSQARDERILEGKKRNATSVGKLGTRQGTTRKRVLPWVLTLSLFGLAMIEASKGPNVVIGTFLLNNRYAFVLFDSSSDRSFMDTRFSSMLNIKPVKIRASYEVELADRGVVSTNTVLKGYTLNLVNHLFEIDLMSIELGMFDVIIGMDWLVKHDAIIICGEKVVRIPYGNKTLTVESDKGVSRLKEKQLEDVPIILDFLEVFPEELPGLPPSRQVEFRIDLEIQYAVSMIKHWKILKDINRGLYSRKSPNTSYPTSPDTAY